MSRQKVVFIRDVWHDGKFYATGKEDNVFNADILIKGKFAELAKTESEKEKQQKTESETEAAKLAAEKEAEEKAKTENKGK
jgi:hypothetical protein